MVMKLDRVTPLVANPPNLKSTTMQKPSISNPPLETAVTFKPIKHFFYFNLMS